MVTSISLLPKRTMTQASKLQGRAYFEARIYECIEQPYVAQLYCVCSNMFLLATNAQQKEGVDSPNYKKIMVGYDEATTKRLTAIKDLYKQIKKSINDMTVDARLELGDRILQEMIERKDEWVPKRTMAFSLVNEFTRKTGVKPDDSKQENP